jgi:hypothetical protein
VLQSYANAEALCRAMGGRVADYGDWRYRSLVPGDIFFSKSPPMNLWLGPITGDNRALYVNAQSLTNFDGESDRFVARKYVCAHDR